MLIYKKGRNYEKDKVKLRRKEALVAKQKVVLYGVNNYVDLDKEKAQKQYDAYLSCLYNDDGTFTEKKLSEIGDLKEFISKKFKS